MLATIGLIVTLCSAAPDTNDACDSYVVDTFTTIQECVDAMPDVMPALLRKPSFAGIACGPKFDK